MSVTPYLLVPTGDGDAWRCDLQPSELARALDEAQSISARYDLPVWIVFDETRGLCFTPDGRQTVATPPRPRPTTQDVGDGHAASGHAAPSGLALPTDGPTCDTLVGPWIVTAHMDFRGAPRGSHSVLEFHADHTFTWQTPPEWFVPSGRWDVGRQQSAQPLLGIENRKGELQAGLVRIERRADGVTWRWHQPHRIRTHFGPLVLTGQRPPLPDPW